MTDSRKKKSARPTKSKAASQKSSRPRVIRLSADERAEILEKKPKSTTAIDREEKQPRTTEPLLLKTEASLDLFQPHEKSTLSESDPDVGDAFKEAADSAASASHGRTELSIQDEKIFRAFQSNFLSLISHELRTPFMGVQNSIQVLEEEAGASAVSERFSEWVQTAKRNVSRLGRTLQSLIDLASIESGQFHVRLGEMDLLRFASAHAKNHEAMLQEKRMLSRFSSPSGQVGPVSVLGDPQKLGRAYELIFSMIAARGVEGSPVDVRASSHETSFEFSLDAKFRASWESAWTHAVAARESGLMTSSSMFGATTQSEEDFLSRAEEGLGNEFLLVSQIARIHEGEFLTTRSDQAGRVQLVFRLPALDSERGLLKVLVSRLHEYAPENGALGSVVLLLVAVPDRVDVEKYRATLQAGLYRSTDSVVALPARRQLAVLLNDCKAGDIHGLVKRLSSLPGVAPQEFRYGAVAAPDDGIDPAVLMELALRRLRAV